MWFDAQTAGLVGGITGGAIGVTCGALGIMAGIFARKGKYKNFILAFAFMLIICGAALLCTGIIALATRQPYHVWYPFVFSGALLIVIIIPNYIVLRKTYTSAELKKMDIDDL